MARIGKLISFEGLDGSGKTTQALLITERLTNAGFNVVYIREPGGTQIGEEIRNILIKSRDTEHVPCKEAELLLYIAARIQSFTNVVNPLLRSGTHVIIDRFNDSTIAMQGYARDNEDQVRTLIDLILPDTTPDKTIYLSIPVSFQEKSLVGKELDRLEQEGRWFHEKVLNGFHIQYQLNYNRWHVVNATIGDAFRDISEINDEIYHHVVELLK